MSSITVDSLEPLLCTKKARQISNYLFVENNGGVGPLTSLPPLHVHTQNVEADLV